MLIHAFSEYAYNILLNCKHKLNIKYKCKYKFMVMAAAGLKVTRAAVVEH